VAALEQHLGVKLLQRTTRHVHTTEAGKRYLQDARRILAELEAADNAAVGINAIPQGHLVVTAPVLFGRLHVMPAVVEYLNRYPETSVECIFVDRVVNMLEEGIDVGVRIGELPDSSMHARTVGKVGLTACASPSYLAENGCPESPQDLSKHQLIASRAGNNAIHWRFDDQKNPPLRVHPRLTVSTNDAAIKAAVDGFGITRLLSYQLAPYLESGELVAILEDHAPAAKPIHIVHREGHQGSAKARAFIDLVSEQLKKNPSLQQFG
ncbi:MAG: LysR substrate-binding domain-containing protein, partial [Motiliproteus sp.]|nr:LysR substrate-binding domain-containing protein [Motiliproteus sp.]